MLLFTVLEDALWSAIVSVGFAILFQAPRKTLFGCAVAGGFGHAIRKFLITFGMAIETATFLGALAIGFWALYFSRRYKTPSTIFSISGCIPMIPGLIAYGAIQSLINLTHSTPETGSLLLYEASVGLIRTGLILMALTLGILIPRLVFQREKPVV
ncbi:MAG: threonine/serine exporter family protein [Anaerolineae bacterium]|jgi:uncharacterized membrane protein YjjB (DUF3815 family)|nr:threonine/serine exporter family protein [Anaerolineae bacterium]